MSVNTNHEERKQTVRSQYFLTRDELPGPVRKPFQTVPWELMTLGEHAFVFDISLYLLRTRASKMFSDSQKKQRINYESSARLDYFVHI